MKQSDHHEMDKLLDEIPNATSPNSDDQLAAGDHSGHLLSSSSSSSSSGNISFANEELRGAQYRAAEQRRLTLQQLALTKEFEAMHVGNRNQPAVNRPLINPQDQYAAARSPIVDWSLNRRFEDRRESYLRRREALLSNSNGVPAASGSQRLCADGCSGLSQCNSGIWDEDFVSPASSSGFRDQDFVSAYMQARIHAAASQHSRLEAVSRRSGTLGELPYISPARSATNFEAVSRRSGTLGELPYISPARSATNFDEGAMGNHYFSPARTANSDEGAMGNNFSSSRNAMNTTGNYYLSPTRNPTNFDVGSMSNSRNSRNFDAGTISNSRNSRNFDAGTMSNSRNSRNFDAGTMSNMRNSRNFDAGTMSNMRNSRNFDAGIMNNSRNSSAMSNTEQNNDQLRKRNSDYGYGPMLHSSSTGLPRFDSSTDLQRYVYHMAKDQEGCRYLQGKFEDSGQVDMIINEIIDHAVELTVNSFGNYLMQKMLDVCSEDQRMRILCVLTEHPNDLVRISLNTHGTRVVQKLIETLRTSQQMEILVSALEPGFLDLMKDLNGNHVIQRCLNFLPSEHNKFIYDNAVKYCVDISTHRHGCCVMQRCIDRSTGKYRANLVAEISVNGLMLAQDSFGNYVVQYILELRNPSGNANLVSQFKGHYVELSIQKCSSNVIEKCLKFFREEDQATIIEELLTYGIENSLQDPYANYVILSALENTKGSLRDALVKEIRPHVTTMRNSPFCKRIFDIVRK